MPVEESAFTIAELRQCLVSSGLRAGDVAFLQLSFSSPGRITGAASPFDASQRVLSAILDLIGPAGTLFVPAFTFSFDRGEEFDVETSPSVVGRWSDAVAFADVARSYRGAVRSNDPLYSIVGIGPAAGDLLSNLPSSSFGPDSVFDRLSRVSAKLCLVGVSLENSILLDFAEETTSVPWRYRKLFTGMIRRNGKSQRQGWIASTVNRAVATEADMIRRRAAATAEPEMQRVSIGGGAVLCGDYQKLYDCLCSALATAAASLELKVNEDRHPRVPSQLPPSATMSQTISALWRLPRDIVSDGYDAAMHALATQVPLKIHEYPTGSECWTWLVPEKWTCHDARLETLDGRVLFSYRENPLHAVSYSLPFNGVVSRDELFDHLYSHARLDDAIPFIFKYYERDWGLCCSKNLKESLTDDKYRVVIDSEFSFGSLKVGECVAKGKSDQTFLFCAHLCHPGMVNDDLTGVVVGIQVMQELLKRTDLRYTYRFLILPETIGSVAYLSHNGPLIPHMVGGLFLEMLGLDNPHALQLSFDGNTEMDRCLSRVLSESSSDAWTGAFRTVVGNDERQFNAPGVRVPMLSLSRVLRERSNGWPYYPEYHSSHDTPELASEARLAESRDLVLRMVDAIEANEVPVNLFKGEVFCSRYGLHIDAYSNPEGNRALFNILFLVDGTRSVAEIARICGISVEATRKVLAELQTRGLVAYAPLTVAKAW